MAERDPGSWRRWRRRPVPANILPGRRRVLADAPVGRRSVSVRRKMAALGALVVALAPSRSGEARASGGRVGVVVATRVNLSEGEADLLAASLGEALRTQLQVDVIAGLDARRRLPPEGIPEDCVARLECVRDVATRLDGDELLFLFLVKIGTRLQIDTTWADPIRGEVVSRPALVVEDTVQERARVLASAAPRLLPHRAPRIADGAPEHAAEPAWTNGAEVGTSPEVDVESRYRRGRRFTTPVIVVGAAAAAALATGTGFAIAARLEYESLDEDGCATRACPGVERRVDRMERNSLIADTLLVTGGVALATSAILYLTSSEWRPPIRIEGGPGTGFVSLEGRF